MTRSNIKNRGWEPKKNAKNIRARFRDIKVARDKRIGNAIHQQSDPS